jgi:lysophospholipase L1-like esterase
MESLFVFANRLRSLVFGLSLAGAASLAAAAQPSGPWDNGYLALGDSVVFGYITGEGNAYINSTNFIGYPEYVGYREGLAVTNSACPGETTSGFISWTGADNGCRPFRANFPLHVNYTPDQTQLSFATAFLSAHKRTKLVTIGLGANDGFLLQKSCAGAASFVACVEQGLPGTLATIYANMNTILSNLKATGFKGVLMVVNYYSLDYSDPVQTAFTVALNKTLANVASANGAVVADAYLAFEAAATPAGGKTCLTGLLNGANPQSATPPFLCDVHPTLSGQRLLAKTVESAFAQAAGAPQD